MARVAPFVAKDFAANTQHILYALAYWVASADEELRPQEQEWLAAQFGEAESETLFEEFRHFTSEEFLATISDGVQDLQEHERHILPKLKLWLLSLAHSDGVFAVYERIILVRALKRLGLYRVQDHHRARTTWRLPFSGWTRVFTRHHIRMDR